MAKHSIRYKLVLAFAIMAIVSASLTTIIASYLTERQFGQYLGRQRQDRQLDIVKHIEDALSNNELSDTLLRNLSSTALTDHSYMRVIDSNGQVIWETRAGHGQGMMERGRGHQQSNLLSEASYPIYTNNVMAGEVIFGYLNNPYLTQAQQTYSRNIWQAGLLAAGVVAILGAAVGSLISYRMSEPLRRLTQAVHALHPQPVAGQHTATDKDEVAELTQAFDELVACLRRHEQSRQQLTADIAHELRTPLSALQAQIEAIQDGIYAMTPERLSVCHEEVIRLSNLINNLENLARLEEDNALHTQATDLSQLVKEAVESYRAAITQAGLQLHTQFEPTIAVVDADKIKQVIINLLSNSVKYTPAGGQILVSLSHDHKTALISVQDTGKGIPEADLPFVFTRFYRGEKSRSRRTGGAGLGLAITKAIVDAHRGTITVKNRPEGGTCFTVCLPLANNGSATGPW